MFTAIGSIGSYRKDYSTLTIAGFTNVVGHTWISNSSKLLMHDCKGEHTAIVHVCMQLITTVDLHRISAH